MTAKKRILIVDDMRTMLVFMPLLIGKDEFDFDFASSGEEALLRIEANLPDLIISDMKMSGMSGAELCRRLRANPAQAAVPVLVASGELEDGVAEECTAAGATELMAKPLSSQTLRAAVARLLAGAR